MKDAGIAMLTEKFDAFGETMPDAFRGKREAPSATPGIAGRIGRYVFWLLVLTIVAARVSYYPVTPAFEVSSATGPSHALTR